VKLRDSSFKENTAVAPPLNAKIINVIQQKTKDPPPPRASLKQVAACITNIFTFIPHTLQRTLLSLALFGWILLFSTPAAGELPKISLSSWHTAQQQQQKFKSHFQLCIANRAEK
jgi:hypothetical protein